MAFPVAGMILRGVKTAYSALLATAPAEVRASLSAMRSLESLSEAELLLINRGKSITDKALSAKIKSILNVDERVLSSLLGKYRQTTTLKNFAKGSLFKREINRLSGTVNKKIKELISNVTVENISAPPKSNINDYVKNLVLMIEKEVDNKLSGMVDNRGVLSSIIGASNFLASYKPDVEYTWDTVRLLEKVLTKINQDIENYSEGSGEDLVILATGGQWARVSKQALINYINDIKTDLDAIL